MALIRLLLTAAEGPSGRAVRRLLDGDDRVVVTGIDATAGFPRGDAPGYRTALFGAVLDHDRLLVTSDAELRALLPRPPEETVGCPPETIAVATDKALTYRRLGAVVAVPAFIVGGVRKHRLHGGAERLPESDLVTEHLPGPEVSADALCWHGEIVALVIRERSEVVGRAATAGVVGPYPAVEAAVRAVAAALPLHGGINLQFRCADADAPVLIDLNARFGGGIGVSAAAGVNLPRLLVDLLVHHEPRRPTVAAPGFYRPQGDP